jgi:hypothetical protein
LDSLLVIAFGGFIPRAGGDYLRLVLATGLSGGSDSGANAVVKVNIGT